MRTVERCEPGLTKKCLNKNIPQISLSTRLISGHYTSSTTTPKGRSEEYIVFAGNVRRKRNPGDFYPDSKTITYIKQKVQ